MPEYPESEILTAHLPCPACGSHDALTEYTDGHTYCFSCRTHTCAAGTPKEPTKMSKQLIQTTGQYPVLTKRRISEATIRKFNYQTAETPAGIVHIAPYYNHSDELCAQHLRGAGKKFSWRGNTDKIQLFGQRLWNQGNRKVIITEGELDCMSISQIQDNKWPVVSIPSGAQGAAKAIKDNLDWLETFQEVVICFDTDQPGETAAMECAQILSPGKAKIAKLPLKDASDMLQAGRGKELLECIWNASTYRPEGIISGTDLWDAILKEPVKGHMTPFEKLNELTYGIRPAELWLFTAGSGIGKSTIVHEIGYKLLMQDKLKIGVMALEEPKEKTAKRYISIHINKPIYIDQTGITEATLRDAFDKTIGQKPCRFELYDHFGSTDIDLLIGKIRYMLVALDVDILILDHISIVVSGLDAGAISEGERRTLDILMSKLKSLTVETNKTILAVAHLKRPEQGKSWNEGKEPRLTDLRGSAALEQLSDMVIALYRDQSSEEESNTAGIIVLKNRPIGPVGKAGYV
ncbi:MAG: DnaB-like helicase C-terminal domain-containing protein, partial [Cloacibacillus sp.]